jgi:hypothetical protein
MWQNGRKSSISYDHQIGRNYDGNLVLYSCEKRALTPFLADQALDEVACGIIPAIVCLGADDLFQAVTV